MARSVGATTAVRYRLGSEWRIRWRAWLGLALAIGIAGGVTLAAAAGARRAGETLINPRFASAHRLHVGSRFPVVFASSDAHDAAVARGTPYKGPQGHATLTVTGIGRFARDVIPTTVNDEQPLFYVTP